MEEPKANGISLEKHVRGGKWPPVYFDKGISLPPEPIAQPRMPLDAKDAIRLSKAQYPTPAEVAQMLKIIKHRHAGWGVEMIGALTATRPHQLNAIERRKAIAHPWLARLIWVLYMLDARPDLLADPLQWSTWGKINWFLPKKRPSRQQGQLLRQYLTDHREDPERIGAKALGRKFGLGSSLIKKLCVEYNYVPNPRTRRARSRFERGGLFDPLGPWMNIDWSLKVREIRYLTGRANDKIIMARRQLLLRKRSFLEDHWRRCGKNPALLKGLYTPKMQDKIRAEKLYYPWRVEAAKRRALTPPPKKDQSGVVTTPAPVGVETLNTGSSSISDQHSSQIK